MWLRPKSHTAVRLGAIGLLPHRPPSPSSLEPSDPHHLKWVMAQLLPLVSTRPWQPRLLALDGGSCLLWKTAKEPEPSIHPGNAPKCLHQKFFLKSTLTFPLCALHQLAPSRTSFPVHPTLLLLLKRDYQAEQEPSSKKENKSLCSFPALTFSVHRVHPRPPQKPTGHWSLHPKMSQGPSEGVEPGYRNFPSCQARALLDTNFCPAFLALGAKIGFPAQRGQSSCGQTQLSPSSLTSVNT